MEKFILTLSFMGIGLVLIFGLVDPTSPVMWLASTSANFVALRAVMMVFLLALLFTHPPRHHYLRVIVGTTAVLLVGWTLNATYNNHMKFLDTLSLLEVGISAGLVALERDYREIEESYTELRARLKPTAN